MILARGKAASFLINCCKFPLLALEKTCPLGNGNLFGTHSKIRLRSNLFFSLERNTDKKNIILMSTRCLRSAALSSSVNELLQPRQQYLAVLALSKGLVRGQQETNPTGGGMVFCQMSVPKRPRAGAREGAWVRGRVWLLLGKM